MLGDTTTVTPIPGTLELDYVAEEDVTVPAGSFTCDRLILNKGNMPRLKTWTQAPGFLPVQLRYGRLNQYDKLVE